MTQKQSSLIDFLDANEFLAVSANDTIRAVACDFPRHHTSAAAVLDAKGHLIGLVTEKDIVEKAIALRINIDKVAVSEIMRVNPVTIQAHGSLVEALDIMTKKGFRTLPVMDGNKFIGIIDIRDLYEGMQKLLHEELKKNKAIICFAFGETYGATA